MNYTYVLRFMGFVLLASVADAYAMKEDKIPQLAVTYLKKGDVKALQFLLDENPHLINKTDRYGQTLLHGAAMYDKVDMIDLLLNRGATIDQKDNDGNTALYLAIYHTCKDAVRKLIGRGASIIESNNDGYTPLRANLDYPLSDWNERAAIILLLQEAKDSAAQSVDLGAGTLNLSPLAIIYVKRRNEGQLQSLLDENPDMINKITGTGATLLHVAAMQDNINMVKLLLKNGAKINQQDLFGDTALHIAIRNGFNEVVDYLLKNGANILISNNNGYTPLKMDDFEDNVSSQARAMIRTLLSEHKQMLIDKTTVASESTAVQPVATTRTPAVQPSVAAALAASASGKVSIKDLSTEELLRRQDRLLNKLNLISQELQKRHTTSPL